MKTLDSRVLRQLAALFAALASTASAQINLTWNGGSGTNSSWAQGANWNGVAPTFNNTTNLTFYSPGAARLSNFISANRTIRSLTFNDDADADVLIRFTSTGPGTDNLTLTMDGGGSGASINVTSGAAGNFTLGNANYGFLSLADNLTVNHAGSGNLTISSAVTGAGNFTKTGAGSMIFSGNTSVSDFTGILTIANGNLSIGTINNASSVGVLGNSANAVVLGGSGTTGSLRYTGSGASSDKAFTLASSGSGAFDVTTSGQILTLTGAITGGGGLIKNGAGTLYLSGDLSYAGDTVHNAGTLRFVTNAGTQNLGGGLVANANGVQFTLAGTTTFGGALSGSGNILLSGASTTAVFNQNGNSSYSGVIAGAGRFTKGGSGTLEFSGANSFSGLLTVANGALSIATINNASTDGTLGNSAAAVALGGSGTTGTLLYTGGTASSNKTFTLATGGTGGFNVASAATNLTLDGLISGSGNLTKTGDGTLTLTAANNYSGLTRVNAGELAFTTNAKTLGGGLHVESGATANVTVNTTFSGPLTGTGTLAINGTPASTIASFNSGTASTFDGTLTGTGRFQAAGASTVITITGNNTGFTGQTWANAGTFIAAHDNALGNSAITLVGAGGSLELANGITLTNALAFAAAGINKELRVAAGNSASYNGTVAQNSANTAFINVGSGGNLTINGAIGGSGAGAITKTGDGNLILTATNTYSGATNVDGGLLHVSAGILGGTEVNVNNGGTLRISGAGNRLQNTTDLTLNAGGTFDLRKNQTIATLNGAGDIVGSGGAFALTVGSGNFSGNHSGTTGFTKTTAGTLILSGTNTYSGNTTVSEGSLLIHGSTGNSSVVNVDSGTTLGGTGTIGGAVNVTGVLSPGASIESLGSGTLTFNSNSTFSYEIHTGDITADLQFVNGDLDLFGTVTLDLTDLASISQALAVDTKFTLISYTGTWNGTVFDGYLDESTFTFANNLWRIDYNDTSGGSNFISDQSGAFVTMTVIPEPRAALLGSLGLLMLLRRRR